MHYRESPIGVYCEHCALTSDIKAWARDGRVELHAIISTDGTIESLEVVSGDALFYQSALDAVRRWRYRATRLNGQAVKVDTYITVIYTMQR